MEENMIRGAILAMHVENDIKTKLFDYLNNLEQMKVEYKIMKKVLVENNLWEKEVQKALLENDIMKACMCRVLANKLREDIGEERR